MDWGIFYTEIFSISLPNQTHRHGINVFRAFFRLLIGSAGGTTNTRQPGGKEGKRKCLLHGMGWGVVVRVKRAEKGVGVDAAGLNRLPANRNYRTVT